MIQQTIAATMMAMTMLMMMTMEGAVVLFGAYYLQPVRDKLPTSYYVRAYNQRPIELLPKS